MKKDLRAVIETFVLLQTAAIVWVSVGSSSFIHRHCYSRVSYKFFKKKKKKKKRQGPPGPDIRLSPCSHRNKQKAKILMTVFSCSVLSFIF